MSHKSTSGSRIRIQVTRRQLTIVAMVADGATDRTIAGRLGISRSTVSNTLTRLYRLAGRPGRAYLASLYSRGAVVDRGGSHRRRS